MLKVLDLFSGIGGFSLGLERTGGFKTVAFCEIEPFCQQVLKKHWPDVPIFPDVTELSADDVGPIDVITGGFPCQDISTAGKQSGMGGGTRSGLWSEIARLIGEIRPRFAIVENVPNLLSGPSERRGQWFGRVLGDLAALGYDAEWHCIPASYVGRPTIRDRVWIMAFPNRVGLERIGEDKPLAGYMAGPQLQTPKTPPTQICSTIRTPGRAKSVCMDNGLPNWMGGWKAYGNAVVPQIPEIIGSAILQAEGLNEHRA